MQNYFNVQMIGIAICFLGTLGLIMSMTIFGRPLTRDERNKVSRELQNHYRIPVNLETIVSTLLLAAGMGILVWAKFDPCSFLGHWFPNLPAAIRTTFSCR